MHDGLRVRAEHRAWILLRQVGSRCASDNVVAGAPFGGEAMLFLDGGVLLLPGFNGPVSQHLHYT
jgi:hypothetical protein